MKKRKFFYDVQLEIDMISSKYSFSTFNGLGSEQKLVSAQRNDVSPAYSVAFEHEKEFRSKSNLGKKC